MVLMLLERVPTSLRGELTRWLLQPHAGVFVGNVSAMVREKLWEKILNEKRTGAVTMIYSAATEQGFAIRTYGQTTKWIEDFEGLLLVKSPAKG
jgi:CRISPR-associated protein Cas2